MSGATQLLPSSSSRAEKWNRSNSSSNASRQSALVQRAGPSRRSRAVGSNSPPFRNGRRPNARAAPERRDAGRLRAPKHSGSKTWRWKWRRVATLIEAVDQVAPVAVQPTFRLHEGEEQDAG